MWGQPWRGKERRVRSKKKMSNEDSLAILMLKGCRLCFVLAILRDNGWGNLGEIVGE